MHFNSRRQIHITDVILILVTLSYFGCLHCPLLCRKQFYLFSKLLQRGKINLSLTYDLCKFFCIVKQTRIRFKMSPNRKAFFISILKNVSCRFLCLFSSQVSRTNLITNTIESFIRFVLYFLQCNLKINKLFFFSRSRICLRHPILLNYIHTHSFHSYNWHMFTL